MGPLIGGFIVGSLDDWRWTMWLCVIAALAMCLLAIFTYPETYPPKILLKKARTLRKKTGNKNIICQLDEEETTLRYLAQIYLVRPWGKSNYFGNGESPADAH